MVLSIDSDFGPTSAALMLTSCTGRLLIWQFLRQLLVRRGGFPVDGRLGEGVVGVALGEGGDGGVGRVVGGEEEGGGGAVAHCGGTAAASQHLPNS